MSTNDMLLLALILPMALWLLSIRRQRKVAEQKKIRRLLRDAKKEQWLIEHYTPPLHPQIPSIQDQLSNRDRHWLEGPSYRGM